MIKLFAARAAILEHEARERVLQKEIELAKLKQWVGLTQQDKLNYLAQDFGGSRADAMDWAEKILKERNT